MVGATHGPGGDVTTEHGWYERPDQPGTWGYWDGDSWSGSADARSDPTTADASPIDDLYHLDDLDDATRPAERESAMPPTTAPTPVEPAGGEVAIPSQERPPNMWDFDETPSATGPRFVGDANLGGISVRQGLDAACYVIAGIALFVLAAQPDVGGWTALFGVAAVLYGLKIVLLGGPYWVSSFVYVLAGGAVLVALGAL